MEDIPLDFRKQDFKETPLTALSKETLNKLSNMLNKLMIIHSEEGYERDWRGLAALTEQRNLCDQLSQRTKDPFKCVVELWCENKPRTATFGYLVLYLGVIDCWHVIEDVEENFRQDFLNYQQGATTEEHCVQDNVLNEVQRLENSDTATTTHPEHEIVELPFTNNTVTQTNHLNAQSPREDFSYDSASKVLTSNDVQLYQHGLPLQRYDAFVLYADKDYNYALEILLKLQNNPAYNFKFCLKDDLLFGIPFEHIALMELIRERCKFLIAILTKEFIKSPENRFFVNYAQALQIKHEIRKVIPLMYEDQVEIPANLAMFSRMRYNPNRSDLYWSKLADSMQLLQFGQGPLTYSETFPRSIVSQRPSQPSKLAIEAENFHSKLEAIHIAACSSGKGKKSGRKRRLTGAKTKLIKTENVSVRNLNKRESTSSGSGSCCSHKESKGILSKLLFCCK